MVKPGISSACYYPLTTEESFLRICKRDIKCIELFLNSPSEIESGYIKELIKIKEHYGVTIPSLHPFMSFAESFYLFSSYERRFYDILDLYKRFFEVMNEIGAKIFVIHGIKIPGSISDAEYCDRFHKLITLGKEYNINVCHENVVNHRSQSSSYLKMMKDTIGEDFGVVLDIKQARRSNEEADTFIDLLGSSIKHVHISDYNDVSSCIPPLEGFFDFSHFFKKLKDISYEGHYIIELYDHSYNDENQIYNSFNKIHQILVDY
ncbi:MAG: sugar phosphate isomerase/epimerase [Clostridia bacterium]|nr:sugar phosphate isomerase/epimerase [Clostridia bacterium]